MFSQQDTTKTKARGTYKNSNHLQNASVSRIEDGSFYLNEVLILEKILDSDDLNECVSIILNKERSVTLTQARIADEIAHLNQTLAFKGSQHSKKHQESLVKLA